MPTLREKSKLKHICEQRRLQGAVYFSQHAKHRKKLVKCVDRHGDTTCFLNGTKLIIATKNLDWHWEQWKRDKTLCRFWGERAKHDCVEQFNRGSFLCICNNNCSCRMQHAGRSP